MDAVIDERHFELHNDRRWLPIYTQPLHERKLLKFFQEKGLPCYLPMLKKAAYKTVRSQNRTYQYLREVYRPMFSGYLFACLAQEEEESAWRTRSVVRIFRDQNFTQEQLVAELNIIRRFELAAETQKVEILPHLVPGTKVMIAAGPWEGIYGVIESRRKPLKFIVNLDIMEQAIATEIDITNIKLVQIEEK
jgi:transcription antitermination factor NusG